MNLFETILESEHEQIVFCNNKDAGLKIVAGPANNQLANDACGDELEKRNILYAPDYAVNAGGLMNVSIEFEGWNHERAIRMSRTILES